MSSEFTAASKTAQSSDTRTPVRYIWSHVRRHWWVAILLLIGAFSNAALASVVPFYTGYAFDKMTEFADGLVSAEDALAFALTMVMGVIISQAIRAVLQLMRNFSSELFAQRIERDVRDELYASLLGKSMAFFDMQPVGDIMARVTNDVREMNFMMNPGFNLVIGSSMFLILPVMAAPLIHPQLVVVPIAFLILHTIVQYRLVRSVHPIAQRVRVSFGEMNSRLAESLDGLQVVKGAAQEENEIKRFTKLTDEVRDHFIEQGEIEARYLSFLFLGLAFVAAMIHSMILYQAGIIKVGDVVAYLGQIYLFGFPVFTSLFSLSRIASGYASARRILNIINYETGFDQNEHGYDADLQGAIEFENVTFAYNSGTPVLRNISFKVKPGQTVAIVGQTGSGKTSITKLINRTYDVSEGRILVDGRDIREWKLEKLRSSISVIEQDIFLFSRTIKQNIAFGVDDIEDDEIVEAAKMAQAHDFISEFPDGYETVVGQRGVTLSGGQRQRLALARAFESDPPILILDDSTSAIDSATEDRIQKAIWAAAKGRTTLLITHRLSQIRWADHIIVMRNGEVAGQGSHEELMASSDAYRRIFARYDEPVENIAGAEALETE
jgi:ATP-binding cassette subfamily B protein